MLREISNEIPDAEDLPPKNRAKTDKHKENKAKVEPETKQTAVQTAMKR